MDALEDHISSGASRTEVIIAKWWSYLLIIPDLQGVVWAAGAQRALCYACEEAEHFGTNHIDCEHLLLGLMREETNGVARLLQEVNRDKNAIRTAVEMEVQRYKATGKYGSSYGEILPTAEFARAIHLAKFTNIPALLPGTVPLLLGLLLSGDSIARRALWAIDGDFEHLLRASERLPQNELTPEAEMLVPSEKIRSLFANIQSEEIEYVNFGHFKTINPQQLASFTEAMRTAMHVPIGLLLIPNSFTIHFKPRAGEPGKSMEMEYAWEGMQYLGPDFRQWYNEVSKASTDK